jgi:hypothetical protein
MEDSNYWNCSATIMESKKYYIDGLNIWEHQWKSTREYFLKKDPVRQINDKVTVYEIKNEGKLIRFGAKEVSRDTYLIYTHYK